MYHGVWPQLLAATLWAASLGLTWRALADPRPRRVALAALVLGASLWAHPFALLTAAASAAVWAVLVLLGPLWRPVPERRPAAPGDRPQWHGPWRVWALVHAGGALLGAGWLVTFFGGADAMGREPVPWTTLADLGTELLHGRLLSGHWAYATPLALVGGAVVIRRGGTLGWVVLGLVAGMLVLASEDAITVLRLDLLVSGFKNLQFPRYAIPLKPLVLALAGVGAAGVIAWARARGDERASEADARVDVEPAPLAVDASAWIRRGAAALVLAPLVATLVPQAGRLVPRPVAALDTLPGDGLDDDEAELLAALRDEATALAPERPLTVAVMRSEMGGGTYPIFSVTDAGGRLAIDSHVPTVNLEHALRRRVAAYASLGVTHVIHDLPVPDKEQDLAAALELVGRYGPFSLERFTPPPGRTRRVAELMGRGSLEVLVDQTERLELDVTDVRPGTTLALGRAPHHRWEVTLDGEPLETQELRLDKGGLTGLGVELPGSGRVVVEYRVTDRERQALWISAAMLALGLAAVVWGGPPIASAEPSPRARRIAWAVVGVGGLVLVVGTVRRQEAKLEQTWVELAQDELRPRDDRMPGFVRELVLDDGIELTVAPERICSGLLGKDVHEGCSEAAHAPSLAFLYREPYMYRCTRISLAPDGEATLQFPALPDRQTVISGAIVRHDRSSPARKLVFGSLRVDQQVTDDARDFVLDRRQHGEAPVLTVRNEGWRIEQVCVAAALVQRP
jgi:hypothetical protein